MYRIYTKLPDPFQGDFEFLLKNRAQLFKTNDVVSKRFVKISNINITNTLLFFVEKM